MDGFMRFLKCYPIDSTNQPNSHYSRVPYVYSTTGLTLFDDSSLHPFGDIFLYKLVI